MAHRRASTAAAWPETRERDVAYPLGGGFARYKPDRSTSSDALTPLRVQPQFPKGAHRPRASCAAPPRRNGHAHPDRLVHNCQGLSEGEMGLVA
jgi:hypothetical protein